MINRSAMAAVSLSQRSVRMARLHRELLEHHRRGAINAALDKEAVIGIGVTDETAVNTTVNKEIPMMQP